jgi:sugar transferase (PEP-CTERM/EpsH1 system associated)
MRILWIKAGGIYPLDTGGKIRSFHIARELARRHELTLFTYYAEHCGDRHPSLAGVFSELVLAPLRLPAKKSIAGVAQFCRSALSGRPYTMSKYDCPALRERVGQVLRLRPFDAIVCDFVCPADLLDWSQGCPKVLFTHNVEARIWERHCKVARNPLWKLASYLEYKALARAEEKYVRLAGHVVTVSEPDRAFFSRYTAPSRITAIPTGVDTDYFQPRPGAQTPGAIVFTGSMDWMPNEDGVLWFAAEVLPLIRRDVPEAEFWIVGRNPSALVRRLERPGSGIHVTGRVEDIRPYLERAAVYAVPIRSGSGTRLKIFEAMAAGKAIVSTSIGAEGLPVRHGADILSADSPDEFAARVVALLGDRNQRERLGTAARALVERSYGWNRVAGDFEAVLAGLTGSRCRPSQ